MSELDERTCEERVKRARFQERANSITRMVLVALFIAGAITHWYVYLWLLVILAVFHLFRLSCASFSSATVHEFESKEMGQRKYEVVVLVEILFDIAGIVSLMPYFLGHSD
jgi:hypothetical protein